MKRTALVRFWGYVGCVGCVIVSFLLAGCGEGEGPVAGTDLKLVNLRIPSRTAVRQGSTITMSIVVLNNGTETVQASATPFTVTLFFYRDAALTVDHVWEDGDFTTNSVTIVENSDIPPGEYRVYDVPITVLPSDPLGMVFCLANVDTNLDIAEAKEDNNALARSCQVVAGGGDVPPTLPDLTATTSAVGTMTVDTAYNVSVTLTNSGGEAAVQPFSVTFAVYDDDPPTNEIRTQEVWDVLQNLDPAADVSHDFTFTPTALDGAITVYFVVTADSTGAVTEADETNNESSAQSDIVLPSEPDLTISFSSVPASVPRGGDLPIQVTVTNGGGADAGPFTVKVESYTDASHENTLWTPETVVEAVGLAGGANKTYDLTFTARVDDDIADVYLVATVDSVFEVAESDEGNNEDQDTSSVILPNKPDLEILSIAAPNNMPHLVPVNVTVTITNTGGVAPTQQFYVSFDVYGDVDCTSPIRTPVPWQEWQVTDPLPPGGQISHDFSFDPKVADGEKAVWFKAVVDSTGVVIDEFLTTNNSKKATSQIVLPPKADLVAQIDHAYTSDTLDESVENIRLGYTITNSGSADALGSLVMVELRDGGGVVVDTLGPFSVPILVPGASYPDTHTALNTVPVPRPMESYDIVVIADGTGVIDEEDESNNEDAHPILIY